VLNLWNAIKSNPYFVSVSSLLFGAIISELYAEAQTGHLDFTKVGWERLGTIAVTALITALYHLYVPTPKAAADQKAAQSN
jgi:hypothetical protein